MLVLAARLHIKLKPCVLSWVRVRLHAPAEVHSLSQISRAHARLCNVLRNRGAVSRYAQMPYIGKIYMSAPSNVANAARSLGSDADLYGNGRDSQIDYLLPFGGTAANYLYSLRCGEHAALGLRQRRVATTAYGRERTNGNMSGVLVWTSIHKSSQNVPSCM
jgi:hypothetical protein